ncbi:hypothetical protein MRX96_057434 [Rhipicephalus microplus]
MPAAGHRTSPSVSGEAKGSGESEVIEGGNHSKLVVHASSLEPVECGSCDAGREESKQPRKARLLCAAARARTCRSHGKTSPPRRGRDGDDERAFDGVL